MKFLITAIIIATFCFPARAQTNLIEQMHVVDGFDYHSFEEFGDYYYFITYQTRGPLNTWFNQPATQFFLNKYNRNTHQLVASVYIAGDTLQNDSMVAPSVYMVMRGKNIHINYTTRQHTVAGTLGHNYYAKLDTALNFIIPIKPLPQITGWLISGGFARKEDGDCILGHFTGFDDLGTSKYLMLDSLGNETGNDTLGDVYPSGPHLPVWARELIELPDHNYIATGKLITYTPDIVFGWLLYNDSMQKLDTFNYKTGLEQDPEAYTQNVYTPRMIGLPSGSLISANSAPPYYGDPNGAFPRIVKHTAVTRFGVDGYIAFPPVDPTDTAHGNYSAVRSIAYNPFDNNLYYADITHMANDGLTCAYNSEKSFLEIISVDTHLNFRWRKFIKMQGNCTDMGTVSVPDGRNGILVAGRSFQEADMEKEWAYYINDTTPSDNPTSVNDVAIKKEDGFVLYPIPAGDEIHLIALDRGLKEATLYDLNGKLLCTLPIISGRAVINTSQLNLGIYTVKATNKKGNLYQKKLVKK